MTLTQLEYVVALDEHRHFALSAEKCFVTQPTLSMQIQKLEEELGIKIFDRTKQPVIPTEIGAGIIAQARIILREAACIRNIIDDQKDMLSGELRIGIIPTLAPYLLPPLYKIMREKYPNLNLVVKEYITENVIHELKNNRLDCGLVVTPAKRPFHKRNRCFFTRNFSCMCRKKMHCTIKNMFWQKKSIPLNSGYWKKDIVSGHKYSTCVN